MTMSNLTRLNLGAGRQKIPGWTSVDWFAPEADVRANLFEFPWQWPDASVDEAAMFHFLEHVPQLERTILEVHRILKPGGTFHVVVPHARNTCAYDIDHKHRFTAATFYTMASQTWYHFGGKGRIFETVSFRMPLIQYGWLRWTPMDEFTRRWPILYEKICPIAPAVIDWVGRRV
jgi:ubiquinone/menaquinone biosynthesis C-methylase UbiE